MVMHSPDSDKTRLQYLLNEMIRLTDQYSEAQEKDAIFSEKKAIRVRLRQIKIEVDELKLKQKENKSNPVA